MYVLSVFPNCLKCSWIKVQRKKKRKVKRFFFYFPTWICRKENAKTKIKTWERQKKVKQKDAVKNSGPVTSTGPSKDRGPLYYSLFHAVSAECLEMPETEVRVTIMYLAPSRRTFIFIERLEKFMRTSDNRLLRVLSLL